METSAVSSAALTGVDTDALLKLIETIRAEKAAANSPSEIATRPAAENVMSTPDTAEIDLNSNAARGESQPALGRYVNIWA